MEREAIMALTKRTRYEVLKRDNHACRYCGGTAPDVKLTVDHVVPTALGGSDAPDNLVAACADCNAGKGSTSPTEEMVAQVGEDDMRWAAAIQRAAETMLDEHEQTTNRHGWFYTEWSDWDKNLTSLPGGVDKSLDYWLGAGLPREIILGSLHIALGNRNDAHQDVFAYMGGICRSRIKELHDKARELIDSEGAA